MTPTDALYIHFISTCCLFVTAQGGSQPGATSTSAEVEDDDTVKADDSELTTTNCQQAVKQYEALFSTDSSYSELALNMHEVQEVFSLCVAPAEFTWLQRHLRHTGNTEVGAC